MTLRVSITRTVDACAVFVSTRSGKRCTRKGDPIRTVSYDGAYYHHGLTTDRARESNVGFASGVGMYTPRASRLHASSPGLYPRPPSMPSTTYWRCFRKVDQSYMSLEGSGSCVMIYSPFQGVLGDEPVKLDLRSPANMALVLRIDPSTVFKNDSGQFSFQVTAIHRARISFSCLCTPAAMYRILQSRVRTEL